jgi:hypothetical protein
MGRREEEELNPQLVICLLASVLVGLSIATTAVVTGWGLIAGLLLYVACGSTSLVVLSLAWPERRPAVVRSRRHAEKPALA